MPVRFPLASDDESQQPTVEYGPALKFFVDVIIGDSHEWH